MSHMISTCLRGLYHVLTVLYYCVLWITSLVILCFFTHVLGTWVLSLRSVTRYFQYLSSKSSHMVLQHQHETYNLIFYMQSFQLYHIQHFSSIWMFLSKISLKLKFTYLFLSFTKWHNIPPISLSCFMDLAHNITYGFVIS